MNVASRSNLLPSNSPSSAQVCSGWSSQQSQPIIDVPLLNMPHGDELVLQPVIDFIIKVLSSGEWAHGIQATGAV